MAIRRVTDLRTGLEHPVRDRRGRFISRARAALEVRVSDQILHRIEKNEPGYDLTKTYVVKGGRMWVAHVHSGTMWNDPIYRVTTTPAL